MPAGLTIYNTDNTVQIDENWRNYGFRQKISTSITTSNFPGTGGAPSIVNYGFTTPGTAALLCACQSESQYPWKLHQYFDGSNWTFNWRFSHDNPPIFPGPETKTGAVNFYIFDVPEGGTYSKVGLEVFTATGARAFHSDMSVMKVAGIRQCDTGFSVPSGRSYAPLIMRNPICGRTNFGGGGGFRIACYCLQTTSSLITSKLIDNASAGASGEYTRVGAYAAIDVTGL